MCSQQQWQTFGTINLLKNNLQAIWQQYLNNIQHQSFLSNCSSSWQIIWISDHQTVSLNQSRPSFSYFRYLLSHHHHPTIISCTHSIMPTLKPYSVRHHFCVKSSSQYVPFLCTLWFQLPGKWAGPGEREGGLSLSPRPTHFPQSSVGNVF